MRLILSCLQSVERHALPPYLHWRTYFLRGLQEAGHEVLEVPEVDWAAGLDCPADGSLDAWRAQTWDAVLAFVRARMQREKIDLFLSYLYPRQVEAAAIRELQRVGIPCVNFFCDNVREFRKVPSEFGVFTLNWVPEFEALPMYSSAGFPHVHVPMPCWIPDNFRTPPADETSPPTFIGSADVLRGELFVKALEAGAEFVVRGSGWRGPPDSPTPTGRPRPVSHVIKDQFALARSHGAGAVFRKIERRLYPLRPAVLPESHIGDAPVGDDAYYEATRRAIVTIGVNRVPTAMASDRRPLAYSRLRDIEAPMLGACYLTEWTAGIEHLYDPGSEIEIYRAADELTAKLRELKENPERRWALRRRGQRRALEEHSVGRSLARIGAQLGLHAGG